jgi:hypothetical protein
MASVKALRDGEEQGLECLGELRAVKGALAKELLIQKPVTIPGAGSYLKDFTAPLYGHKVMAELAKGEKGCGPCVGVLAKDKKAPKGYVRRQLGPHLLCIPVYDQRLFSSLAWKVLGPGFRGAAPVSTCGSTLPMPWSIFAAAIRRISSVMWA